MSELVLSVAVRRGPGPVSDLPARPVALEDVAFAGPTGPTTLGAFLSEGYVDGLAVLHDGALVFEAYGNGMERASLHLSQSVAKSLLGLLCGVLVGQGRLDPAAFVPELVPEVAGSGYAGATVSHLLDMTAAIDFVEDYAASVWRWDMACAWHPPASGADAKTILEFLPRIRPADGWEHGERFHYATPNSDLLGIVVERSAGAPLAQLIGRELWAPLGAERDADLTTDPAGTGAIGGGFSATLRDYARCGALVLAEGRGVVSPAWIARLGRGDPGAFARCTVPAVTSGATGYGRQWWRRDGRTVARGIHGQLVAVDHDARVVVTVLSSWPEATHSGLERAHRGLVAAVCERLASASVV